MEGKYNNNEVKDYGIIGENNKIIKANVIYIIKKELLIMKLWKWLDDYYNKYKLYPGGIKFLFILLTVMWSYALPMLFMKHINVLGEYPLSASLMCIFALIFSYIIMILGYMAINELLLIFSLRKEQP